MDLWMLLNDGEKLLKFITTESPIFNTGYIPYEMIIPSDSDIDKLDLGRCLEETLNRLLEYKATDDLIEVITGMRNTSDINLEEESPYFSYTNIDKGYILPGEILKVFKEETI